MKRVGCLCTGLLGALAASLLLASGAAAAEPVTALPQLGRCVEVATGTGEWRDNHCLSLATPSNPGSFNWLQGPGTKPGFSGEAEGLLEEEPIKLETANSANLITCQTALISGEYTGAKSEKETIHVIGCTLVATGQPCSSAGQNEGQVQVSAEQTSLGFVTSKTKPPRVGWDLNPISVNMTCLGSTPGELPTLDTLEGSVIAHSVLRISTMVKEFSETFTASGGIQKPQHFEKEPNDVLMSKFTGPPPTFAMSTEQTGLVMHVTSILNGERLEIKAKCTKEGVPCT